MSKEFKEFKELFYKITRGDILRSSDFDLLEKLNLSTLEYILFEDLYYEDGEEDDDFENSEKFREWLNLFMTKFILVWSYVFSEDDLIIFFKKLNKYNLIYINEKMLLNSYSVRYFKLFESLIELDEDILPLNNNIAEKFLRISFDEERYDDFIHVLNQYEKLGIDYSEFQNYCEEIRNVISNFEKR